MLPNPTARPISPMRARRTISVTDFRKNPVRHLAGAKGDTLAVLSRNRVEFYDVPPLLFEALLDRLEALGGSREFGGSAGINS
ncbi:plasmid stabilization protein [Parvibaculum sp.]|uniref:plasmid stabilization protein n=1 Tax=Parvibaculum sp. TaxID=2024848 RepID=UPI001E0F3D02|nr:plasmid stabilization protein [Parvibaculum sp.]MBX3489467.1 plasmid stabilization protein [Parvibaculum sp.]MCW5726577.1 plasmid stabilization protein [Parvibaculum sp.]